MRVNLDASTLLILAAGGWLWWSYRRGGLGPPSDEMLDYVNRPVKPPVWDGWTWWQETEQQIIDNLNESTERVEEMRRQRGMPVGI
jgi:hypothetical protein